MLICICDLQIMHRSVNLHDLLDLKPLNGSVSVFVGTALHIEAQKSKDEGETCKCDRKQIARSHNIELYFFFFFLNNGNS